MNFKLLMGIAIIFAISACNATKKVNLTKEETNAESTVKAGDSFEGKIFYDFSMKDKSGEMPEEAIKMMFGEKQVYIIKKDKYKAEFGGQMSMKQYYIGGDSLFMEMAGIEGLMWNDVNENTDKLKSVDIEKNVEKVAGVICNLITIKSDEQTAQYYYSSDYPIDPADYAKHDYAFWKLYVEKAKAVPLKMIVDDEEFYIEATATEIKPMKINDNEFDLPNIPRVKNPEP